jgi:hypothetical protein
MLQIFGLMKYVFPSLSKVNIDHMKQMKELKPILTLRLIATHSHNKPEVVQAEMTNLRYSLDVIKVVVNTLKQIPEFMKNASTMEDEYLRKLAYFSPEVASYLFAYGHVYAENFNVYETEERYGELEDQIKQNPLPVTGNDLVALGMKPSPEFKRIIDTFKAMYIKNPLTPREEYLKLIKR